MKTLESFFSRTAQFGLLIYLTGCFGLLIVLGAAVAKQLKLIDVIQYIAFAFGLGLLTLLIGMVGLSLLGIRGIEEFQWNDPIPLSSFNITGGCTFVHQDDELHLYGFPSL